MVKNRNQSKNKNKKSQPSLAVVNRAEALRTGASRFLGNTAIYRGVGAPDEIILDLVYTQSTVIAATAAAAFTQLQSSLFDPEPAVGGTQPLFFDQWAGLYAWYQVLEMIAESDVMTASSTAVPVLWAAGWSDEASPATTVDGLANTRFGKMGRPVSFATPQRLRSSMTMARIHGYGDVTQVDSLQALVTANPSDLAYYTVGTVPHDGTTSTARTVRTKMTYRVRFFGLITPAAS